MSITDVRRLFVKIQGTPRADTIALRRRRQRFMELLLRSTANVGRRMTNFESDEQRKDFVRQRFARFIGLANGLKGRDQMRMFVALLTDTVWAYKHTVDEHQERVADGCLKVARELQGRGAGVDQKGLWLAARLHDFGKIGWSKEFLHKPPPLSPEDLLLIETHLYLSLFLMEEIKFLCGAAEILRFNHAYDGYPYCENVENMPLEGQILSAVDCFDALISPRVYRGGQRFRPVEAYEQLTQRPYHPDVLSAIFKVLV